MISPTKKINKISLQLPDSCPEIHKSRTGNETTSTEKPSILKKTSTIARRIPFYPEDTPRDSYLFHPQCKNKTNVLIPSLAKTMLSRPTFVSIEGNIGAGKSSFLKILQEKYKDCDDIMFIQEPVDLWETVKDSKDGKNILQKYYMNPIKYAFAFQVLAFTTRLQLLKRAIQDAGANCKVILMERSLDADHRIFAKMLLEDNILEPIEFQIYETMANEELKNYSVDKIIWLNTSSEECMRRIHTRNRIGEENISNNYLQKCDACHREWLNTDTGFVFILNEEDQREIMDSNEYNSIFNKIEEYLGLQ